jgi:nitrite reductase/ring-hydroxylating ferredoxin subunit
MIRIGKVTDFPLRDVRIVSVEGRDVAVVRWGDEEFYAVHNRCPHMGGPVGCGGLGPKIVSRGGGVPGRVEVDDDVPALTCPWHKWEFQLKDGVSLWDSQYRVKTYPVTVENGEVVLQMRLPRRSATASVGPRKRA